MALFNLLYDTKEVVWHRAKFNVEANTIEEAVEKLREHQEDRMVGDDGNGIWSRDGDYLIETSQRMTPEENGGDETIIIYQDATNSIDPPSELWNNGDPLSKLNKHGKKLFNLVKEYTSQVWDDGGQRYRRAIGDLSKSAIVNLVFVRPTTLDSFNSTVGVPKNFPAEIANGIMHILKTGKPL